jgi:hypothetical protein
MGTTTTGSPLKREYEGRVRAALDGIGRGSFRVDIDETAAAHMISHHAIKDVILRELRRNGDDL